MGSSKLQEGAQTRAKEYDAGNQYPDAKRVYQREVIWLFNNMRARIEQFWTDIYLVMEEYSQEKGGGIIG